MGTDATNIGSCAILVGCTHRVVCVCYAAECRSILPHDARCVGSFPYLMSLLLAETSLAAAAASTGGGGGGNAKPNAAAISLRCAMPSFLFYFFQKGGRGKPLRRQPHLRRHAPGIQGGCGELRTCYQRPPPLPLLLRSMPSPCWTMSSFE